MNPRQFLIITGVIFFIIGILGYIGVIGPIAVKSIFHTYWYFDNAENMADTLIGMICLFAVYAFPPLWQKYLVIILGIIGVITALYGWVISQTLFGASLENPTDNIFHLVFGIWALYASLMNSKLTKE